MNILIICDISNPYVGGTENVSWRLGNEFECLGHNVYYIFKPSISDDINNNHPMAAKNQYYLPNSDVWDCGENREYFVSLLEDLKIDVILNQVPEIISIFKFVYENLLMLNVPNVNLVSAFHYNPYMHINDVEDVILYKGEKLFLSMRESLCCNPIKWAKALSLLLLYKTYRLDKFKKREGEISRFIYEKSDAFVLLSEEFKQPFRSLIGKEDCEKLYSITNPVAKPKETIDIQCKQKVILYVGRLVRVQKRVDRLLMIWKKLYKDFSDWRLVIVGDGGNRINLEQMSRKHKLERVEFKGRQIPDEYYNRASILALTSTFEGFGLVLVEAQQAGCIPMSFNSFESVTDIITDGRDGFLIAPFDLDAYAKKLSELMSSEDLRVSIMNNCLTKDYSKFDIENVAPQWIELFEKLKR